jgi:hypothetical protein
MAQHHRIAHPELIESLHEESRLSRCGPKAITFACVGPHLVDAASHFTHNDIDGGTKMANLRQEEQSTQNAEDTIRHTGERTTEQTRRIGLAAAQAGEEVAQASTHLLQQNAEMLQNTWRFGVDMATAMMGRSGDQLSRTFGLTGDE